ncbi:MAG: 3-dehydroquinate synthase [Geobacteraceae bacterium]|nr:3-dehydroquinate synthase [Geobacteraceae bacterium]
MKIITVGLDERSYNIHIGCGLLDGLGADCNRIGLKGTAAVITNPVVGALYLPLVKDSLERAGYDVRVIELPDGEEFKNAATLDLIYDAMITEGLDRGAFIVALGGGVIGDMAGFAAATFLRGIPFVQVPTTLLAQVDSSVGGKTGINHRLGKNLIGAFYQPKLVLADLDTLDTLAEREYLCGIAEILKYGACLDRSLFDYISEKSGDLKARDKVALEHIVGESCTIKGSVVERDEHEGGLRAVLNYGHTIGHAVETLAGYGKIKHGEAVAIGMAQIAGLSFLKGLLTSDDRNLIVKLIREFGLPTELPVFPIDAYLEIISHDKKKRDGGVNFIFNHGIGGFKIEKIIDLRTLLSDCVNQL